MTKTEIAKLFSTGQFEVIYGFLANDVEWLVLGETRLIGKQDVVAHCKQVGSYFESVTTDFRILNVIADGDKIAINGTAEFLRDNKRVSYVSACDLYEFNPDGQIEKITSYCIQTE